MRLVSLPIEELSGGMGKNLGSIHSFLISRWACSYMGNLIQRGPMTSVAREVGWKSGQVGSILGSNTDLCGLGQVISPLCFPFPCHTMCLVWLHWKFFRAGNALLCVYSVPSTMGPCSLSKATKHYQNTHNKSILNTFLHIWIMN